MRMQPIDEERLGTVVTLLSRGFPKRKAAFWQMTLPRLSAYHKATNAGPIGHLMMIDDDPVGVVLTIASHRTAGAERHKVKNLAYWCVDPKHRWLAPAMLQKIVSEDSVTFTDLSPSPEARAINERLGFRVANQGVLLCFLPLAALAGRSQTRVVALNHLPPRALDSDKQATLAYHQDLGCIAAALEVDGRYFPLLFTLTRRQSLPVARLVLAESFRLVSENIIAIARFLLRRRVLFLAVYGDRDQHLVGGITWKAFPVQVKGTWDTGRIDQTFSDIVFFQC